MDLIITIFMKGAPRSTQFDDIYFSAENGLEETRHVFLEGNNLPQAWEGQSRFVIAETGFGTGLNFLSAWKLFEETAKAEQELDFISVEKYPLSPDEIRQALEPWSDNFGNKIDLLLQQYPLRVAGFHRIKLSNQITLTLVFDDVNAALPELQASVNCWFLDGFTPAKNPQMWTETLYREMARLSVPKASYATFTAAGDVRRGLAAAGFSVAKQKGYGRKRDMINGHYQGEGLRFKEPLNKNTKIAIIGGGLAGTACAYVLRQYGYQPVIYEKENYLAAGASGNKVGFYNPRFSAQRDAMAEFFIPAYAQFVQLGKNHGELFDYDSCGALHLINSPEKEKRFKDLLKNWNWYPDHIKRLTAPEASKIAGLEVPYECLYLPESGSVCPEKLCRFYAQDIKVHFNHPVESLNRIEADIYIIANSYKAEQFHLMPSVTLDKIRGQVTEIESKDELENLRCSLHYGGYVSKSIDGRNVIGATFQKWLEIEKEQPEDDETNISSMAEALKIKNPGFKVLSSRAGFRSSPNDRFPLSGAVPDNNHIYISAAFGSHGIIGSFQSAMYITDLIRQGPLCLPDKTAKALNPNRFMKRAEKKRRKGA
jgi:tRNA 5-methylaminomethyl-2-thiouridine biosynthesis bifunctional protein